jgi:hypothetical protein
MKYISLILLIPSLTLAGNKVNEWKVGCESAFVRYTKKAKDRSIEEGRKIGQQTCSDLANHISKGSLWGKVSESMPRFEGCMDAVNLMLDTSEIHDPKRRKSMLADFCLDV